MPTSVRLDKEMEVLLRRLAKRRGQTKSQIIREALESLAGQEEALGRAPTPFDAMAPSLGCVGGGPSDLSERTGRRFVETLKSRRRG